MKFFKKEVPIFQIDIIVVYDCSQDEAVDSIYARERVKAEKIDSSVCDGWTQKRDGCVLMWVQSKEPASIVFHELVHVAFSICDEKGMMHDEELIAYLMGWLKVNIADEIFYEEG